jgi:hypothetical protein
MTTPAEEYRLYARECLRWACETDNEEDRQALLEMAKVWTQLAMHGHEQKVPLRAGTVSGSAIPAAAK